MKSATNNMSQKVNRVKQTLEFFISDTTEDQTSNVIHAQSTVDVKS